jgi:hypothetical protein
VQALLHPVNQNQKKYFGGMLTENDRKILQLLEQKVLTMLSDSVYTQQSQGDQTSKNDSLTGTSILGKRTHTQQQH